MEGRELGPDLRRHTPAPMQECPPTLQQLLILVEGMNDMRAVRRAVNSDVFVLGSATHAQSTVTTRMVQELRAAAAGHAGVVIFTDPDVAGRQARQALERQLPGCYHAFVPAPLATAAGATAYHEIGNIGVEHAAPSTIRRALSLLRVSDAHRTEFTRDTLLRLGLVAELNQQVGGGAWLS